MSVQANRERHGAYTAIGEGSVGRALFFFCCAALASASSRRIASSACSAPSSAASASARRGTLARGRGASISGRTMPTEPKRGDATSTRRGTQLHYWGGPRVRTLVVPKLRARVAPEPRQRATADATTTVRQGAASSPAGQGNHCPVLHHERSSDSLAGAHGILVSVHMPDMQQ